jgi:peptide/nickel transport system substrate-binding protein
MTFKRVGWPGAVVATLAVSAVLAACSSSGQSANSASTTQSAAVVIGTTSAPTSLDPAVGTSGGDYQYLYMIYARLINQDPKTGAYEPGLATSWKFTGTNNLAFEMTLRQGVKFQDGTPVNAAAVKTSLEHFIKSGVLPDLASVKSISTPGPYSVVLNLSSQFSALPAILADRAGMIISPAALAKYGKNIGTHPVGAGPYEFVSETPNASIALKRFAGYYQAGFAKASGITWQMYTEPVTMENALRSGTINVASGIPPTDASALKSDSGLTVSTGPSLSYTGFWLNTKLAPLNNQDVREAIQYALNRNTLAQAATDGAGKAAWEVVPPGTPDYAQNPATYSYDPAKAKQLLAQAGDAKGVSLSCITPAGLGSLGYPTIIPFVQNQLAAVGIHITFKSMSLPASVPAFFTNSGAQCYASGWSGRPDPEMTLAAIVQTSSYFNAGHTNYNLQSSLDQLNSTYTASGRLQVMGQIYDSMHTLSPTVILFTDPEIVAYNSNVSGFVPSFSGKDDMSGLAVK